MPISCENKKQHGLEKCRSSCRVLSRPGLMETVAVPPGAPAPPADPSKVDVVFLDMHHGWPSLGYDSILFALRDSLCDVEGPLQRADLGLRVLVFDVRRGSVPRHERGRFRLYVGSGGPGHIDPALNDGVDPVSQGIHEDPSWEPAYGALLNDIIRDEQAAYLAVCHSFGLLCRHLGVARPTLRGDDKGGKSSGVVEVSMLPPAEQHPWFAPLGGIFGRGRFPALDSRFYDLIPDEAMLRSGHSPFLALETLGRGGPEGNAVTLAEFARDAEGIAPRILGTNFHPEIVPGPRAQLVLEEKHAAGNTTQEWYEERVRLMEEVWSTSGGGDALHVVSDFTFLGPMRYHLLRLLRLRLEEGGHPHSGIDERRVLDQLPDHLPAAVAPVFAGREESAPR